MSVLRQAGLASLVCLLCMNVGFMYSWPSSTLRLFSSTNTTLNRPMTDTEQALFGSLSSIAALISTPFAGFLLDRLGRKYSCVLFSMPQVIAWVIVSTCYKVEGILAAVFISGLGGCIFIVAPVFICEFCQETIRGMMTTGVIVYYGIGMLLSYLLGGSLEYRFMNYACLSLTAVGCVLTSFLKESPIILMRRGLEKEAAESISYYRGVKVNSKEVMQEIDTIRRTLNPDFEQVYATTDEDNILKVPVKPEKLHFWQFLKKSQSTRRALLLCIVLYTAAIFQGLVVVQVYAQPLFEEAVPNVSTTISSVIFAIVLIISGCIAAFFIDKAGRRPLIIYSSIITGICCAVLGTQIQYHWGPHWVSAILLYSYCIAYSLGAGTVPFVIVAEVFLPEIKSIVSMISVEWAWTCNFIILFLFNPLVTTLGLGPIFYIFAVVCFLTAVFCTFCLPETKGLTVDIIQTLFVKKVNTANA
ncbi:sugar transporter ERD6-like 4 [Zerene cesonia]|uniref:sugar transporter ERD6-like 4 n=1 Tax=Zerene cesonia TaxID=33412 RepID=UPI0018E570F0|nr:sugar transporter ERD6-like 4 [Zerene cesonia]